MKPDISVRENLKAQNTISRMHFSLTVLLASDVEVDRKILAREVRVEGTVVELGAEIAKEVPGRIDERVHRVRLSSGTPATASVVAMRHACAMSYKYISS